MGIYDGVPTSICPHSTSGRCDYWGPFVNRAARFGNAAARGGQIMMSAALGRDLVKALTQQELSLEQAHPVLLAHPDFVPQPLKHTTSITGSLEAQRCQRLHTRRFQGPHRTTNEAGPCLPCHAWHAHTPLLPGH